MKDVGFRRPLVCAGPAGLCTAASRTEFRTGRGLDVPDLDPGMIAVAESGGDEAAVFPLGVVPEKILAVQADG